MTDSTSNEDGLDDPETTKRALFVQEMVDNLKTLSAAGSLSVAMGIYATLARDIGLSDDTIVRALQTYLRRCPR